MIRSVTLGMDMCMRREQEVPIFVAGYVIVMEKEVEAERMVQNFGLNF